MNRMEELFQFAKKPTEGVTEIKPEPKKVTVANIDDQLGGRIGRPDMGLINNYLANRHAGAVELATFKKITSEKHRLVGNLTIDTLKAEALLIYEKLKIEWSHQYSALSEQAVAGEMTVIRKLQNLLVVSRQFLYDDRNDAVDRIEKLYKAGKLTEEDFRAELDFLFSSCKEYLEQFKQLTKERENDARTTFRPSGTKL